MKKFKTLSETELELIKTENQLECDQLNYKHFKLGIENKCKKYKGIKPIQNNQVEFIKSNFKDKNITYEFSDDFKEEMEADGIILLTEQQQQEAIKKFEEEFLPFTISGEEIFPTYVSFNPISAFDDMMIIFESKNKDIEYMLSLEKYSEEYLSENPGLDEYHAYFYTNAGEKWNVFNETFDQSADIDEIKNMIFDVIAGPTPSELDCIVSNDGIKFTKKDLKECKDVLRALENKAIDKINKAFKNPQNYPKNFTSTAYYDMLDTATDYIFYNQELRKTNKKLEIIQNSEEFKIANEKYKKEIYVGPLDNSDISK